MFGDIKEIISFYRKFDRYKRYQDQELFFHILPSYQLKQYLLHKQGDEVVGFTNWAFLNNDAEKRFISTGILKISDWKSGDKLWHIDFICAKNFKDFMSKAKKNCRNLIGLNNPTYWIRVDDNNKIYRKIVRYVKESW
jgi:hypothetical protein